MPGPLTIRLVSLGLVLYQLASSASRHRLDLPGQMSASVVLLASAAAGGGVLVVVTLANVA